MNFTISELKFMGNYFAKDNPLNFFNNINAELKGNEESLLAGKGVLLEGKLEEDVASVLKVIADSEKCARLILRTPFLVMEKYTYRRGDELVLLENRLGEATITSLKDPEQVMAEVIHLVGISDIKNVGIDISLTKEETLVFLSLLDLYRKQVMESYWGEKEEKEFVSIEEIVKMLASLLPNSLVKMMVNNYNYLIPSADKVPLIIENLKAKEIVSKTSDSSICKLEEPYALLGKTFLIPQSTAILEIVSNDKKEGLVSSGCLFVSAGLHDILFFMFDEDSISINTITCRMMLEIIEKLIAL